MQAMRSLGYRLGMTQTPRSRPMFSFLCAILLLACSQPGDVGRSGSQASRPAGDPQRTLVIAIRVEPQSLTFKPVQAGPNVTSDATRGLFNAHLLTFNADGEPLPGLAEQLPVLNGDSWRVLPDQTMETTYR